MTETPNSKRYDLDERTLRFAQDVREFLKKVSKTESNREDGTQLIKSSGSIGANYLEANEALSRKDFEMHLKIGRTKSKESGYWLQLIDVPGDETLESERTSLVNEANELALIFTAMIQKEKEEP